MKIAVIYSGLVRPQGRRHKDNIWKMKCVLPYADFYYTTWKGYHDDFNWVDTYFDEPRLKYNCDHWHMKQAVQVMRNINDPNDEKYKKARNRLRHRNKGRNLIKQHLAHALAVKKYGNGYDLIVRIRYDLTFSKDFTFEEATNCAEIAYDTGIPFGVGAIAENMFEPGKIHHSNDWTALPDFCIFHRADKFDPQYVWDLYDKKELNGGEHGWYQILCEPYEKEMYIANQMWMTPWAS